MPRTFSAPAADYAPNPDGTPVTFGPYAVDGFTNRNTNALEWTASVEGWPTDPRIALFRLRCQWDNGDFAEWTINGGRTDQSGNPLSTVKARVYVPQGSGNQVASGTMTLTVLAPFRSAFTLAAVA